MPLLHILCLQATVLISVLIAIATGPFNLFVDFLFKIIAAPLVEEYNLDIASRLAFRQFQDSKATLRNRVRKSVAAAAQNSLYSSSVKDVGDKDDEQAQKTHELHLSTWKSFVLSNATVRDIPDPVVGLHQRTSLLLSGSFADAEENSSDTPLDHSISVIKTGHHVALTARTRADSDDLHDADERGAMSMDICPQQAFLVALTHQFKNLRGQRKAEFQARWGILDDQCDTWEATDSVEATELARINEWPNTISRLFSRRKMTRRDVLAAAVVNTDTKSRIQIERLRNTTDQHQGMEIMHAFIIDLLGVGTPAAKIFKSMTYEEFKDSIVVTPMAKHIAWMAVLLLNIYFVYFSILRGMSTSIRWQQIYVMSCFLQILVEVFVYETVECLWIHYTIPKQVIKEVATTMAAVKKSIEIAFAKKKHTTSLDSPKYFFVSRKMAEQFPTLFESSIVLAFQSSFPPAVLDATNNLTGQDDMVDYGLREHEVPVRSDKHKMSFARRFSFSMLSMVVLRYLGTVPIRVQQVIIHTVQPILISFIVLLYFYCLEHPYLAIVLSSTTVVGVILYFFTTRQNNNQAESVILDDAYAHDERTGARNKKRPTRNVVTPVMPKPNYSLNEFVLGNPHPATTTKAVFRGMLEIGKSTYNEETVLTRRVANKNIRNAEKIEFVTKHLKKVEDDLKQALVDEGVEVNEAMATFCCDEDSDEYKYLYDPYMSPFVNSAGEQVSIAMIASRRKLAMAIDGDTYKANVQFANKFRAQRKRQTMEWDQYRMYHSEYILPFVNRSGILVDTATISMRRQRGLPRHSNFVSNARVEKCRAAKQKWEHELLLLTNNLHDDSVDDDSVDVAQAADVSISVMS